MEKTTIVSAAWLRKRAETILLKHGFNDVQASSFAAALIAAEQDGCKSHGVYRLDGALRSARAGKLNPAALPSIVSGEDGRAIVVVNAAGGFANPAFDLGMPLLTELTQKHGIAALVINECAHLSALWFEVEMLAKNGLAAMSMCPSYATVAPAGGTKALLGTNPFAFGWPRSNDNPYVFDFATSVAARGEIELHLRDQKPLPEGWAIDTDGKPTTDPASALSGAMLPFGAHKGSAISTMIELLAGAMIGDRMSPEVLEYLGTSTLAPVHGELVIAFDTKAFSNSDGSDSLTRAEALFDAIVGQGARMPSQRRYAARQAAIEEGIRLSLSEIEHLNHLANARLD